MSCFKQLANILDIHQLTPNAPKTDSFAPRIDQSHKFDANPVDPDLWKQEASKAGIQSLYLNASFDNCHMLPSGIVELGKNWVKLSKKPSLYLHGNTGSGKTYFATAIFRALVEKKRYPWIIFVKSYDMDDELLSAIEERQEKATIRKYVEVPILFIDDLGVERPSERMVRQYFSILDKRIGEELVTIITSNVPRGSLPLGDRTISRLEHFYAIEFPKKDIRKNLDLPPL